MSAQSELSASIALALLYHQAVRLLRCVAVGASYYYYRSGPMVQVDQLKVDITQCNASSFLKKTSIFSVLSAKHSSQSQ